jgi:hypothetical protein
MPIRETVRKVTEHLLGLAISSRCRDRYKKEYPKGEIFWCLRDTITGEVQRGKLANTVVLDAGILIARFFKGPASPIAHQSEPSFGVFALAMGTGNVSWDPLNPPQAHNTQRSLWNELGRKAIQSTQFIDGDGNVSGIPTNIVDFTTTFSESEAVGPLCEMGLLGADINTNMAVTNPVLPPDGPYDPIVDLVGKDTLVNYLTFPVISKSSTSTLSWTWRLSF